MNKIEAKTVNVAVRTGFTFAADSHFVGYMSARRTLNSLVRKGYLVAKTYKDGRTEYEPTEAARDFVQHGIAA